MNKLTITAPSYRIDNLIRIEPSINFNYIDEWIIVYDGNNKESNPRMFQENKKTKEYIYIYIYMIVYQVTDKEILRQLKLHIRICYYII